MMIKKSKVALFTDLHLGIYGNSEVWHSIAIEWADWVVDSLKKDKITDIFFLGDFFHNRTEISVQTLHIASQLLGKFKDFNMFMIIGNHDAYYKNRSDVHSLGLIQGHENVTIIDKNLEFDAFGKKLLFIPWNSDLPDGKFDYIFGHFEIQNFKMNNFKICDHGLSAMDFLASRTDTVFSGHFHHRNTRVYNEGKIHYIGNTFGMDFSDVGNKKGYHVLDVQTGDLKFYENNVSPKFEKIILSKIKEFSKSDITGNHIKLIVDVDLTDSQLEKVKTYILANKPFQFFVEYNVTTKTIDSIDEVDSVDLYEQIEEFIKNMKIDDEKEKRVEKIMKDLYDLYK